MFKRTSFLIILIVSIASCKSSKSKVASSKNNTIEKEVSISPIADKVITNAKKFEGVRYKYGGDSKKGMDCSGLVVTSFNPESIKLPRTTSELAKHGDWIDLKEVKKGDLLFFATKKNSRTVNHVGIVTNSSLGNVEFIHSTTSKGVITSRLSERYWYFAFVQARRVL